MSNFSDRFGYSRPIPPRTLTETDSEELKGALWALLTADGSNPKNGYQHARKLLGLMPDSDVWSEPSSEKALSELLADLHWTSVYESLERLYDGASNASRTGQGLPIRRNPSKAEVQDLVNTSLERSGLAYEMVGGRFRFLDPESDLLGIRGVETEILADLTGQFEPVRAQYAKSLQKLHALQPDDEGAIGDAVNALEAVAKIITGSPSATLSAATQKLFPEGGGGHKPLRAAIEKIYAFANETPGVRHGRYTEPRLVHAEALMVVRLAGSILSFLIADCDSGSPTTQEQSTNFQW